MIRTHSYDVTVAWTGNRGSGTSGYREYGRDHEVTVSGAGDGDGAGDAGRPQPIAGSSDSAFRGDPGSAGGIPSNCSLPRSPSATCFPICTPARPPASWSPGTPMRHTPP